MSLKDDVARVLTDAFVMSEQPECCRKCGARTEMLEENEVEQEDGTEEVHQLHKCPACGYRYWLTPDDGETDADGKRCPKCDSYRDSPADAKRCCHCGSRAKPV